MDQFDFQLRTQLVFGAGAVSRLGPAAEELEIRHPLLVAIAGVTTDCKRPVTSSAPSPSYASQASSRCRFTTST